VRLVVRELQVKPFVLQGPLIQPWIRFSLGSDRLVEFFMSSTPHMTGFEEVFTVTDYYDGPRQGIANFCGQPHFYDCIFSEAKQDFTNLYRLTPVAPDLFRLAMEDWASGNGGNVHSTPDKPRKNLTLCYQQTRLATWRSNRC
jgi:hypothetical protein